MFRAARGLSQLKVEQRAKLTTGKYWRIENGYDEATDAELRRIAKVLHITIEQLTEATEAKAS
jgi:transcriptional regulator with XRE-family HTH domain